MLDSEEMLDSTEDKKLSAALSKWWSKLIPGTKGHLIIDFSKKYIYKKNWVYLNINFSGESKKHGQCFDSKLSLVWYLLTQQSFKQDR